MLEGYIVFIVFITGVIVGIVTLNIYELHDRRKAWRTLTLGLDDFDIKCINEEYQRRKNICMIGQEKSANKITNEEAYPHEAHNHYIYERVCPQCEHQMCPQEPSDLSQCIITDTKDYKKWLQQECKERDEDDKANI